MDKEKTIKFLEDLIECIKNDTLNDKQRQIVSEFYDDSKIVKYLFTGWWIQEQSQKL